MDHTDSAVGADAPGFAELFVEHRLGLLRLAVLLVGDRETAEDVVQDAFAGLHVHWSRLRDTATALPYTRAAVVNGCHSVLRRRAVRRRVGLRYEPPVWSAESAAMLAEERREVMAALQRLPWRRRQVLVLRYYLNLSDGEIAEVMDVRPATVRATAARALAALAKHLGEDS